MDGSVILIKEEFVKDEIGQDIPKETEVEVFCTFRSIGRTEWRDAGQNGINAEIVVITQAVNYSGERIAVLDGERKAIYRTYRLPDSDEIELYLRGEVGSFGKENQTG